MRQKLEEVYVMLRGTIMHSSEMAAFYQAFETNNLHNKFTTFTCYDNFVFKQSMLSQAFSWLCNMRLT
jgi:hypothetical protein